MPPGLVKGQNVDVAGDTNGSGGLGVLVLQQVVGLLADDSGVGLAIVAQVVVEGVAEPRDHSSLKGGHKHQQTTLNNSNDKKKKCNITSFSLTSFVYVDGFCGFSLSSSWEIFDRHLNNMHVFFYSFNCMHPINFFLPF